jgi:hypothetical protein
MNQFFNLLVLIVGGGISLIALFTVLKLLLPAPVDRARLNLEINIGRSLLLGVVNFLFFGALSMVFFWLAQLVGGVIAAIFIFLGGLIGVALILLTLLGLVALADLLGHRMGSGSTPLTTHLRGGLLLVLAGLAPFIGWFVFTPLALWTGLGATIQAFFRRKVSDPASAQAAD